MTTKPNGQNGQDLAAPSDGEPFSDPNVTPDAKVTVRRDAQGKLLPGSHLNPAGRPHGRPNNTTLAATEHLKAHAVRAAAIMVRHLDSDNEWVAAHAARAILERTLPKNGDEEQPIDTTWLQYTTDRELNTIMGIMKRAQARMPGGAVIDVEANEPASDAVRRCQPAGAAGGLC